MIDKLKKTAERPQQRFLAALEHFQKEDVADWAAHFPVGFRERVAPSWLGEVYATGMTAQAYAKDFVKTRGLGEHNGAREIIPTLAAVDTMLLEDQVPGAINSITLERLCRKAFGIVSAFKAVERRDDWKKPQNAPKTWRSRVNEEIWRRIDPAKSGLEDNQFSN